MHLKEFDYDLPESLIAQHPLRGRDQARLMVIDRPAQKISHDFFYNIGRYLPPQSVLVVNDSKVYPARLFGTKERSGGKVEIFLLKKLPDGYSYQALLRPLKKIKDDDRIHFNGNGIYAQIRDRDQGIVRFNRKNMERYFNRIGHIPLPPYIKRPDNADDRKLYQTVYAKRSGSVAAPTAGLHFTKPLIQGLKKEGHVFNNVTLHINYATFKPVEEEDITRHQMHFEDYNVSSSVYQSILKTKNNGRSIVAVGTTSLRVLETAARLGQLTGRTNLFIYPGYRFKIVDILITNFHLPFSTLLMLVYALGGTVLMKKAYEEAIKERYRFFSYGDAMMIL